MHGVRASAVDIERALACRIALDNGQRITADRVVIARGHSLPRNPGVVDGADFYESRRYLRCPWSEKRLAELEPDADVLLIGTGLTMYDVVLSLRERGHRGTVHDSRVVDSHRASMPRIRLRYPADQRRIAGCIRRGRHPHSSMPSASQPGMRRPPMVTGVRLSIPSGRSPPRSGGSGRTESGSASSSVCGHSGKCTDIARRHRSTSRSNPWSRAACFVCTPAKCDRGAKTPTV